MAAPTHVIRLMKEEEIPQVIKVWEDTGLHEGTQCFYTWFKVDPEAFNVAVTEEGKILGACSAVVHHEDLAFVGVYAVREEYRGKGIGLKLWEACYNHIGKRNAGVNAVPGKIELYRDKGGFPIEETDWKSVECVADDVDSSILMENLDGIEVQPLTEKELPLVLDYDTVLMGYRREKPIALTIGEKDSVSFLALRCKDNSCIGYGTIKLNLFGHGLVGPLYAENQDIAEVILRRLIESFPKGKGLVMMTITKNKGAKDIIRKLGAIEKAEIPRCYKNSKLDVDVTKVFGHLDLNFTPF